MKRGPRRSTPARPSRATAARPPPRPGRSAPPPGRLGFLPRLLLLGLHAGPEGLQEVPDLARRGGGGDHDLLTLDLGSSQLLQALPVPVDELPRVEAVAEKLGQVPGEGHLLLAQLHRPGQDVELRRADLVRPVHRLQEERPRSASEDGEVLFPEEDHPGDGDPARLPQGLLEKPVGLQPHRLGDDVVGAVEVDRVDLLQGYEIDNVYCPEGLHGKPLQLLLREAHMVVLLVLVSLDDVLEGHLLAADGAHPPVADAPLVGAVEVVEAHALLLDRDVEAHRDADQAEGDGPFPDRLHYWPSSQAGQAPMSGFSSRIQKRSQARQRTTPPSTSSWSSGTTTR